jgi:hypothetical protein
MAKELPVTQTTKTTGRTTAALLLAAAALALAAAEAPAVTTLEGYSSFMTEVRNSGGGDPSWGLSEPELYAELKLKTSPWTNVDGFMMVAGWSRRPWWQGDQAIRDTRVFFKEAHARFRAERIEAHVFAGQNRFWLNEPLLELVNQDRVKQDEHGPRAQGIRLDFWDWYGFSGAGFLSERSDYLSDQWQNLSDAEQAGYPGATEGDEVISSTDDYRAFRIKRNFFGDRIIGGTTYARKDFNPSAYIGDRSNFDESVAFDLELAMGELLPLLTRFGRVTWVAEYGRNTSGHLWDDEDPGSDGFKTEIRDIRVGPMRFLGAYEVYGSDFYNLGLAHDDRIKLNDYTQYYLEGHYRVPAKAVNLKGWIRHAEPDDPNLTTEAQSAGTKDEWGTEAYVEFLNGFTGKAEYKVYEDKNGIWPNLFFEVTGENRLVKLRTQYRIKDIDSNFELTAYGFEANVNLGEQWKFYARVLNVDEESESRQTAFAQLRYLGWGGAEFFVEFGNGDQSNDLVNDGDFVEHGSSATTDQVFKAFVRLYY